MIFYLVQVIRFDVLIKSATQQLKQRFQVKLYLSRRWPVHGLAFFFVVTFPNVSSHSSSHITTECYFAVDTCITNW